MVVTHKVHDQTVTTQIYSHGYGRHLIVLIKIFLFAVKYYFIFKKPRFFGVVCVTPNLYILNKRPRFNSVLFAVHFF